MKNEASMTDMNGTPNDTPQDRFEMRLLNEFQRDLPLTSTPFVDMARALNATEDQVIGGLLRLRNQGVVSRVGPVIRPHSIGTSTLAALAVPTERLEAVAMLVNGYDEVNHNYEREHVYNLWFVATAVDEERLQAVLDEIARRSGCALLRLPMLEDYHIDLGFDLLSHGTSPHDRQPP
jgi:DNA-binding Lrp family transcriptional regulator